ncbi:MAG: hypothetical protein LQ342_001158 [Letrouitia transgressa]|nr:MAG: hypothetical protein LQ342_001158 [Letrouitia transgressa]
MNLGDANLRTVTTSRPALVHSSSKQSITASDDYYSLSSGDSSQDDRIAARYQTPPLQPKSVDRFLVEKPTDTTKPSIKVVPHTPPLIHETPAPGRTAQGHIIKRKPVSSESTSSPRSADDEIVSPPTPGFDDTPYIQFALEQLTRDEEVNKALRPEMRNAASQDSYPVERLFPEQVLQQHVNHTKETMPPSDRIQPSGSPSKIFTLFPVLKQLTVAKVTNNIAVPAHPPEGSFQYPQLNYLPKPLRISSLLSLAVCCLLMGAVMIFSNVWSLHHRGLWHYDGAGTRRYFVLQYLPQLVAIAIELWLIVVQCALQRILPFMIMHSEKRAANSMAAFGAPLFPTNMLLPNLWCFRHGEPGFGFFFISAWLSLFTVPLQSCSYQTRYYDVDGSSEWRWTSVQPIAWTLFAVYILIAFTLVLLSYNLRRNPTGLKWDPQSIADILVLFQRSNILSCLFGSEIRDFDSTSIPGKKVSLRYWATSKTQGEIFHGIEEHFANLEGFSRAFRIKEPRGGASGSRDPDALDIESQRPYKVSTLDSLRKNVHSPFVRYGWLPWFLKDTFVVAWIVIATVLMLAFIIVSFVNNSVERGFLPLLPALTTTDGFSPADFLYSFLPCLIGTVLFLLWQPIDFYFRALQPFSNLATVRGCQAESSILLDYVACLPGEVTIRALLAGHYKVAWISFTSVVSITLPVLSGGIFTAQFFVETQDVRMAASMPGYYALVVFVVLYGLSFLTIWPTKKRSLPHDISTLGQIISYVYGSQLMNDAAFWQPRSKTDLVTRLLGSLTGDRGSSRYAFGVYRGQDGKEHLGIDRLHRPNSGEMLITTGTIKS